MALNSKGIVQIYCDSEHGINEWLAKNHEEVEVLDVKFALNNDGECVMVIYRKLVTHK